MVKKLTSFLINQTWWKLCAKATLAAAALGFLVWTGFSFWPVLIFFSALLAIYFSESPERKMFRSSFWLLSLFSVLGAGAVSDLPGPLFESLASVFLLVIFGLLIFGILGLINLFFRNRFIIYNLLHTALMAYFFILAFYFMPGWTGENIFPSIVWILSILSGTALLMKELLVFEGLVQNKKLRIYRWSLAFITTEIALLSAFLPLGFVNAAAFLTLFSILARDVILAHFKGFLSSALIFKELAILAVVLSLIFATVNWVLR